MTELPLYVCDLDGTLLGPDATLSEFSRDGLNRLFEAGIQLTIASSRRTVAMRALMAGVELRLPVIELNGAFVSDLQSGRHLHASLLSASAARAAVEAIIATGADPVISAWDGASDRVYFGQRMNEGTSWYMEGEARLRRPRAGRVRGPALRRRARAGRRDHRVCARRRGRGSRRAAEGPPRRRRHRLQRAQLLLPGLD